MNGKPTVLIVDDEQPLRDFVRRNLEVRHFEVLTAANGLEALAHFHNNAVDLVIVDLMMPHMNGLETIRRIRADSLVPIIVLSALGEEQDKVQALNLGAAGCRSGTAPDCAAGRTAGADAYRIRPPPLPDGT